MMNEGTKMGSLNSFSRECIMRRERERDKEFRYTIIKTVIRLWRNELLI